ncbi:hypothetical protein NSA47_01080 [Irregularibacter muris]|uniref:Twitching motility protein PilT n=1 Tax=Irregularibacter muris TaxID=1796619 RepID=A0AAE3HEE6_9FIRM|nr:hypothetical protein [Irregularibacter muris]MCR1897583.1 hypothetical protein [Irregularibacter muris]
MIKLVCGGKGSGKTKKMIALANQAAEETKGHIIFVDNRESSVFDLHRGIRFLNIDEFFVKSLKDFFGFINGLVAGNYDIDGIYVDNLLDVRENDLDDLENFLKDLLKICEKYQVHFVFSTNYEGEHIPDLLKEYVMI